MRARFGDFEVDLQTGQLRKRGIRVKLQGQPFQVLAALLEKPGEVVTRDDLRHRIWPDGTYVDFDQSLNKAVNKLRDALTDSADRPRYIETLPRRGYRFLGLLERADQKPGADLNTSSIESGPRLHDSARPKQYFRSRVLLVATSGILLGGLVVGWMMLRSPGNRGEPKLRKLTANSDERPVFGSVISQDGKYLAWSDALGIHLTLIATGEARLIPRPKGPAADIFWIPVAWFPDGMRLLANSVKLGPAEERGAIWVVSILGGTATQLRENAFAGPISPDGTVIPFLTGGTTLDREIWVMSTTGEGARLVAAAQEDASVIHLHWSPQGRRLGCVRLRRVRDNFERLIESREVKRGTGAAVQAASLSASSMLRDPFFADIDFCWLPDGRIVYPVTESSSDANDSNLWEIKVDEQSGQPEGGARQITKWAGFSFAGFSLSADGKVIGFQKNSGRNTVFVARRQAAGTRLENARRLSVDEQDQIPLAWSADSKAVIFVSERNGRLGIFRQALDEDMAEQILTGSEEAGMFRVSPDGTWILYVPGKTEASTGRVMRVPVRGGVPERVMDTKGFWNFNCARLPSTMCMIDEPSADLKDDILTAFDPIRGRGRELYRLPCKPGETYATALAPDGQSIALLNEAEGPDVHGVNNRIQIVSITGQHERDVDMSGWTGLASLDWDWDGKALLVSSNSLIRASLLRVDLTGHTQLLWTQKGSFGTWGIPSPDGRYLAMLGWVVDRNVWTLEDF